MNYGELLDARAAEVAARAADGDGFDVWDRAELDYLRAVRERLARGEEPADVRQALAADLPGLEEDAAREAARPSFDWYDDHYHEKLACGRLAACRAALALYDESRS